MQKTKLKTYIFFIVFTEIVGALSGILTINGMKNYDTIIKPDLTPPSIVFPIVWSILFALMGIGAARIWLSPPSELRTKSLNIFLLQLIVNFFWSIFFFNMQAFGFSFIWLILLWVLILLMIIFYWKVDKPAALLQIPYIIWVTFAGYLNYMVYLLNR